MRPKAFAMMVAAAAALSAPVENLGNEMKKYPGTGQRSTDHGKYLPGQFKKRKRLKRLENQARARQQK